VSPPLKVWLAGARPRTLPAAVVPVAVGTAAGYWSSGRLVLTTPQLNPSCHATLCTQFDHRLSWLNAILALVVALGIQVGTNFVNDYADGERGTDDRRVGPVRLVAGGLATVREVKIAALASFGVAAVAGLVLSARVTWWFVPLGLVCGVAGWAYTGGPRPYGYLGLGEVFVFVFFGLVATAGSAYVQHAPFVTSFGGHLFSYDYDWGFALWAGVPVGLLAAALLQANNLRDISTDTESGKHTLAVRLGRHRAGRLYCFTLMAAALSIGWLYHYRAWSLLALLATPLAIAPVSLALRDQEEGPRLLPMLAETARLQIAVGLLLTIGILI
jgi:1,4-dihydroxy-2-naphthoate polyprenyltransferase